MKKLYITSLIVLLIVFIASLSFSQEQEPNNTRSRANKITKNVINGSIGYPGDVDFFYIDRQEGTQNLKFFLTHTLPPDGICMEIYDTHIFVAMLADTKGGDSIRCIVKTNRLYVRVRTWSGRSTGSYQIKFMPVTN